MTAIRTIMSGGERWFSEVDLRRAIRENTELVSAATAMLAVSHDKEDDPFECVRKAIGYFYTEATGVLEKSSRPADVTEWSHKPGATNGEPRPCEPGAAG